MAVSENMTEGKPPGATWPGRRINPTTLLRAIGSGMESQLIYAFRTLWPSMQDDIIANGLTQWLFATATIPRLIMAAFIGLFAWVIWLAFRKGETEERSWPYWLLGIALFAAASLWIVLPYVERFQPGPKAVIIFMSAAGIGLFSLPSRLFLGGRGGAPLLLLLGGLTAIALFVTRAIPLVPSPQAPDCASPIPEEKCLGADQPAPQPTSTSTPTSAPTLTLTPTHAATPTTQPPTPAPSVTTGPHCPAQSIQRGHDYEVKPGDTLSCIAVRAGVELEDLLDANPHKREHTDQLAVGEEIRIP